jgi:hypothetical protein
MRGWLDRAYAAKAWAGAVVAAVSAVVTAAQVAIADEAIDLTEARGVVLLALQALGVIATFRTVFNTKNSLGVEPPPR